MPRPPLPHPRMSSLPPLSWDTQLTASPASGDLLSPCWATCPSGDTCPCLPGDCFLVYTVMGWGWAFSHRSRVSGGPRVALDLLCGALQKACAQLFFSLAWPKQSCSNNTKLLVILHMLQALSHLGDFVPMSPLPGSYSACPRLTLPHLKARLVSSPWRGQKLLPGMFTLPAWLPLNARVQGSSMLPGPPNSKLF